MGRQRKIGIGGLYRWQEAGPGFAGMAKTLENAKGLMTS